MFCFDPSADQAGSLDQEMHTALGESVWSLAEQVEGVLPGVSLQSVADWRCGLERGLTVSAATFGAYYDLVTALEADAFVDAQALFDEIVAANPVASHPKIRNLGSGYPERVTRRFQRYMGNGKTGVSGIVPANQADHARFSKTLSAAMSLISRLRPALAAEIVRLIRDIVLVAPDGASDVQFEGGTSFKLWGALFLNAECTPSVVELAVTLAHEEGRAVLFGACKSEMLVENSDEERFWSPIRQTMRPLEGIFHATFVSARMMDLLLVLRRSPDFSVADQARIESDLRQATHIYREGVAMVERHARWTKTGKRVFDAMQRSIVSQFVGE